MTWYIQICCVIICSFCISSINLIILWCKVSYAQYCDYYFFYLFAIFQIKFIRNVCVSLILTFFFFRFYKSYLSSIWFRSQYNIHCLIFIIIISSVWFTYFVGIKISTKLWLTFLFDTNSALHSCSWCMS